MPNRPPSNPFILALGVCLLMAFAGCKSPDKVYEDQTRDIQIVADNIDRTVPLNRTIPVAVASNVTSSVDVYGNLDRPDRMTWTWEFNGVKTVKNYYFENNLLVLFHHQTFVKASPTEAAYPQKPSYNASTYFTTPQRRSRQEFPEGETVDKILSQTHADKIKL